MQSVGAQTAKIVFVTGQDLHEYAKAQDRQKQSPQDIANTGKLFGYVMAIAELHDQRSFCVPDGVNSEQLVAITTKFIKANPARWHEPGYLLVAESLSPAFPCKR
jgi:hypothetical protein